MTGKSQIELVKIALFSCQELIAALEELNFTAWLGPLNNLYRGLEREAQILNIPLSSPLPPPED